MIFAQLTSGHGAQDRFNGDLYARADLVLDYTTVQLHPPEAVTLIRYREDIQGRRVLDLGCGAGRLAVYLRPITQHYVGVDISKHMLAHCRRTFDGMTFVQGDMRELPFEDGAFDTVFAVFNLFDAVSHNDRLRVLTEVRRVLTPRGLLAFSSHNRNWWNAGRGPRLEFKSGPLAQLRSFREFLRCVRNHRRIKPQQHFERDYALLNDPGHDFAVLHYYITREIQAEQLRAAGFELLECLDETGRPLQPFDDDRANSSLHYIARPASQM